MMKLDSKLPSLYDDSRLTDSKDICDSIIRLDDSFV